MKRILVTFLCLFATSAFAIGLGNDNPGGTANQLQGQNQGQAQGQAQGQLQGQAQAATAISGAAAGASVVSGISNETRAAGLAQANNGGITINEAPIPAVTSTYQRVEQNDYTIRNVPNVFSGNVYPTAPCMGSSTVGGAGVGFGLSVGHSWTDDECGIRETSRSFNGLGMKDDALKVLCMSKYAAAAPSCAGVATTKEK